MRQPLAIAALITALVAGCASTPAPSPSVAVVETASPAPTARPTAKPTPTPLPTASPGIFAGQPYTLDLPEGWESFDLTSADHSASLDAFAKANPGIAGAMQALLKTPGVRIAANFLLGDVIVVLALPSQGLPLDSLGTSLTAQFKNVPGVGQKIVAKPVKLPVGDALHWNISVSSNQAGGGTIKVSESIYLVIDGTTAVIVEFVMPQGGVLPSESKVIDTLQFKP